MKSIANSYLTNPGAFIAALGTVAVIAVGLTFLIGKLSELGSKGADLKGVGFAFLGLSIGIKLIVSSINNMYELILKAINDKNVGSLVAAGVSILIIIGAISGILSGVATLISKFGKGFNWSAGLGLIGAAVAISLLSYVATKLYELVSDVKFRWQDGLEAVGIIAGVSLCLGMIGSICNKDFGLRNGAALFMAAVAISLIAIIAGLLAKLLETIKLDYVIEAVAIIAAIGIGLGFISKLAKDSANLGIGANMLMGAVAICGGLILIAYAMEKLSTIGNINWTLIEQIASMIIVLTIALKIFATMGLGELAIGLGALAAIGGFILLVGVGLNKVGEGLTSLSKGLSDIDSTSLKISSGKFQAIASGINELGGAMLKFSIASLFDAGEVQTLVTGLIDVLGHLDILRANIKTLSGKDSITDAEIDNTFHFLHTIATEYAKEEWKKSIASIFIFEDTMTNIMDDIVNVFNKIISFKSTLDEVNAISDEEIIGGMSKLAAFASGFDTAELSIVSDGQFWKLGQFGNGLALLMENSKSLGDFASAFGDPNFTSKIPDAVNSFKILANSFSEVLTGKWNKQLDFSGIKEIGDGLNSFEFINQRIDTIASITKNKNLDTAINALNSLLGENGSLREITSYSWNSSSLSELSTTLEQVTGVYSTLIEKADTFTKDIEIKKETFTKSGQILLDSFVHGLNGESIQNESDNASDSFTKSITDLIIDRLTNEENLSKWVKAGEKAATKFVSGVNNKKDDIIKSIDKIFSGVSSDGKKLAEVDFSELMPSTDSQGFSLTSMLGLDDLSTQLTSLFSGQGGLIPQVTDLTSILTGENGLESEITNLTSMFTGENGFQEQLNSITESITGSNGISGQIESITSEITSLTGDNGVMNTLKNDLLNPTTGLGATLVGQCQGLYSIPEDMISQFTNPDTGLASSLNKDMMSVFSGDESAFNIISKSMEESMNSVKGIMDPEGDGASIFDDYAKSMGTLKTDIDSVSTTLTSFVDGLESQRYTVINAIQDIAAVAEGELGSSIRYTRWYNIGIFLINGFVSGIISKTGYVTNSVKNIDRSATSSLYSDYNGWFNVGAYLIGGLASGITSKVPAVATAARNAVLAAKQAAEQAGLVHSPSRVFMKIGNYLTKGLAIGISNGETDVKRSTEEVMNNAIAFAQYASNVITDALNSDYTPSIRPVLDLSSMSGLYNLEDTYGMIKTSNTLSSNISANISKIQNDSGSPIPVKAILDSETISALAKSSEAPVNVNVGVEFEGSLSQLATLLYPHLQIESERVGPSLINT